MTEVDNNIINSSRSVEELQVLESFDCSLKKSIDITLISEIERIIEIKSNDQKTLYFKGNHADAMLFSGFSLSTDVPFAYLFDSDSNGIPDSDDDYPTDPTRVFDNYFTAAGFGSLAYEVLWPGKGGYEFNDLVVGYRFQTVTNTSNSMVEIFGTFKGKASGACLENGFGFKLPDASDAFTGNPQKLSVSGYDIQDGYITPNAYGHEAGQTKATIIVFNNIFNLLTNPGEGIGVNTDPNHAFEGYETVTNFPWALDIPAEFEWPKEKKEITRAYLHFAEWAESGGTLYTDWYSNTGAGYRDDSNIFDVP